MFAVGMRSCAIAVHFCPRGFALPLLVALPFGLLTILIHFVFLFSYRQVSNGEPEEDKESLPANPPVTDLGTGNQGTADDPEAEIPANPSREFLKFANQALQLNVSFRVVLI